MCLKIEKLHDIVTDINKPISCLATKQKKIQISFFLELCKYHFDK